MDAQVIPLPNARLVDDVTERMAMQVKLAQLQALAARAVEADARSKRGTDDERAGAEMESKLLLSMLATAARRDWRHLLPGGGQ